MFTLNQPINEKQATYIVVPDVLPEVACDNIVKLSEKIPADKGATASDPAKRRCELHWIHYAPVGGVDALFRKLAGVVEGANRDFWKFHLAGFLEPLQLTHYRAEDEGHYDWHADRADSGIGMNRKISGTLVLNDGFTGGDFQLFDTPDVGELKKGSLILFPSYHVHRVLPVTAGERWSLVFWVTGPPWV